MARADARPWLFGIVANLMRRHWRTERRRLQALRRLDAPVPEAPAHDRVELEDALDALPTRGSGRRYPSGYCGPGGTRVSCPVAFVRSA